MDKQKITTELFKLPIGLKPVIKIRGEEFYGSEKTNDTYIKAMEKNPLTKKVAPKIKELVDNKQIIPCFTTKNLNKFIKWKLFAPESAKTEVGFYAPEYKKIILLFNSNVKWFGYASNKEIAQLTIHECMHKLEFEKLSVFNSIFLNLVIDFYHELWSKIFNIDKNKLNKDKIIKIIKFINKTFNKITIKRNEFVKYYKLLDLEFKDITNLHPTEFKRMVNDYVVVMIIYLTDFNRFYNSIQKFRHIIKPIYSTYRITLDCKNIHSICVQELFTPSEIIAIYSEEHTDSKIYSAINKL